MDDHATMIDGKQNIQINFLFMIKDWLLISEKDLKVQKTVAVKNIALIKLRLKWANRPIWWMDCFDLILGMWPDLTLLFG